MMDWKMCAIEDLRRYKFIKLGIINSKERLAIINTRANALPPVHKKCSTRKKQGLIGASTEADSLRQNITSAKRMVSLIESALNSLTELERNILYRFYMDSNPKTAMGLSDEFGFSARSLYRIRDEALEKFTLAMYGVAAS